MIGKSMRWERFSMKVNTDSRKVNTDSRKWGKSVHVQQESVFTFSRNGCSHWAGMGVQLQREYAAVEILPISASLATFHHYFPPLCHFPGPAIPDFRILMDIGET